MTQWFGKHWGAPLCDETEHVATPVGRLCLDCGEPIAEEDDGVLIPTIAETVTIEPSHLNCHLRGIVGSVAHQMKLCSCYGGSAKDQHSLTRRQAADAAVDYFYRNRKIEPFWRE